MSVIDRFTRDKVSKFVWAAMALAAALGLVYAIVGARRAVEVERADSHDRAVRYVQEVLDRRPELASPLTGTSSESLRRIVRRSILPDERVSRVRIWSTEGTLLFSTDPSDDPGSDEGLNDPVLRDASREGPLTRTDLSDGGGADDPERTLLRTYVPLGTASVAEIDQTDAGTVAVPRTAWFYYQLLAAGVLVLLLVMTAISLRDPIDPINTGVPFAASSVPQGFTLIDDDRLAAVEEVYRLASERVARVQEKLDESEEARRGLESYIQQKLSSIESADVPSAVSATADPPVTAPPAAEPTVVHVPESDVVSASLDAWATAPAGPLARASRAQKPAPASSRKEMPVAEKRKRTLKRPKMKPERSDAAPPEVAAQQPSAAAEPERIVAPMAATGPPAPAAPEKRPAASAAPVAAKARTETRAGPASAPSTPATPVAEAPGGEPRKRLGPARGAKRTATPSLSGQEVDDAKAHAAALETFIRLTESDRQHHEMDTADQSEIRAALARTAARKKPGGDRLQPHEGPPEESLGGPPNGKR